LPYFNGEYLKNGKSVAFKISEFRFSNVMEPKLFNDNHNFDRSTLNIFIIEVDLYIENQC